MFKGLLKILLIIFAIIYFGNLSVFACEINVNFNYPKEAFRDPFVPSDALTPKKQVEEENTDNILAKKHLKLEGILWDPQEPYVIINDNIMRVGDEIEGITILKIEKESVTFGYKDKTIVVPLIGKGE